MTALTRRDFGLTAALAGLAVGSLAGAGGAQAQSAPATAVFVIQFFGGGNVEGFETIGREAGIVGRNVSVPNRLFTVAGADGAGLHVIDVWSSQAAYDEYVVATLRPALQRAGVPDAEVTIVPVHYLANGA